MFDLDLFRLGATFAVGACLSLSTSMIQGVCKNDLASPSTLGIDGISVFIIINSYFLQMMFENSFSLIKISWIFFSIIFLFLYIFTKRFNLSSSKFLILTGLCINLLVGAIFSLIQFFVLSSQFEFPTSIWFGNFKQVNFEDLITVYSVFIFCYLSSWKLLPRFGQLIFGPDFCLNHNIDQSSVNKKSLLMSFLLTFTVINHFGVFSFIGLVFVHTCRILFKKKGLKFEILFMPLLAGTVMLLLDGLCYELPVRGIEIPVGLICSVLGSLVLLLITLSKIKSNRLHI